MVIFFILGFATCAALVAAVSIAQAHRRPRPGEVWRLKHPGDHIVTLWPVEGGRLFAKYELEVVVLAVEGKECLVKWHEGKLAWVHRRHFARRLGREIHRQAIVETATEVCRAE